MCSSHHQISGFPSEIENFAEDEIREAAQSISPPRQHGEAGHGGRADSAQGPPQQRWGRSPANASGLKGTPTRLYPLDGSLDDVAIHASRLLGIPDEQAVIADHVDESG